MKNADSRRETGFKAESAVAAELIGRGFSILARNYHSRCGELDIVAEQNGLIVITEVKYRSGAAFGTPAEAVTAAKRGKIIKTAQIYIAEKGLWDMPVRFDVAEVYPGGINIIEDAFDLSGGGQF